MTRWIRFLRRTYWAEERASEIDSYIEIETAGNIARGMTPVDAAAHIDRAALRVECRKHLSGYKKNLPIEKLSPNYDQAAKRARALEMWQREQGREDANPSTGVYKLTEEIRHFGRPRRA